MTKYSYSKNAKYELGMRFKNVETAKNFAWENDAEVRDHAEDWVDMWFTNKSDLNKFVKLALNDETVVYFDVQK